MPITTYCDEQHLSPKERLELFIPVCHALQHAHQKGIIHRDLKPSNVLVAQYDDEAVPKVIDFGVAKAITQQLTEKTMFTHYGQVVGTLEYMSPEQARVNQLDVDTRSDIYSLGVILYELLTGSPPFDRQRMQSAAFDEIIRIIREEEPLRPSIKLSTIDSLPTISARRGIEPRKLRTLVRGELDWIVMKALEKDRARRYETANGLATDINRFLTGDAVEACPPSTFYRMQKLVARNRGTVAAAAALVLALVLGLVGTSFGLIKARLAEKKATALADEKESLADSEREAKREAQQFAREQKRARDASEQGLYIANMNRVHFEWQNSNIGRARSLLELYRDSELRGWEWYYWDRMCHAELRVPSNSRVYDLGFACDGELIVAAEREEDSDVLKVFSSAAGRELGMLRGKKRQFSFTRELAFAPGSTIFAWNRSFRTEGQDKYQAEVTLFDLSTRSKLYSLPLTADIWDQISIAFSPTGHTLAVSGQTGSTVKLWDTVKQKWGRSLSTGPNVRCLRYSSTGILAVAQPDGIHLWDVVDNRVLHTLTGHTVRDVNGFLYEVINDVAFSPDGRMIASGGGDGTMRLWDVTSGQQLRLLLAEYEVTDVEFSPQGEYLASTSRDNSVALWTVASGKRVRTYQGHTTVFHVAFSPDGMRLASCGSDGFRIWDATTNPVEIPLGLSGATFFSRDGRRMAIKRHKRQDLSVVETATGAQICALQDPPLVFGDVAFDPTGEAIVTGNWNGDYSRPADARLCFWSADNGELLRSHDLGDVAPDQLSFSPDGDLLACVVRRREGRTTFWSVRLLEAATGKMLRSLEGRTVAFSPVERRLAVGTTDNRLIILNLDTEEQLAVTESVVSNVAFSPDGTRVLYAGKVRAVDTGEVISTIGGDERNLTFDATGTRIFSIHLTRAGALGNRRAGEVRVWDAATGSLLCPIPVAGTSLSVSPDGWRCVVSQGGVGGWMLDVDPALRRSEQLQSLNLVAHLFLRNTKNDVLTTIEGLTTASETVKQKALALAERWEAQPGALVRAALAIVRKPGLAAEQYDRALSLAREGYRLGPRHEDTMALVGMALYRCGQYEDAITWLERDIRSTEETAIELSFIAMAQIKLNRLADARQTLARASDATYSKEATSFLQEATELLPENHDQTSAAN